MATKKKLQELLKDRETPKREAVTPVSLYTKPQEDKETESIQVDKTTSTQRDKATKQQPDKETRPQGDKKPYTLGDKTTGTQVVKYTTHLKKETIKAIKRYAVEAELKDYEIVQEAIDRYLKGKGL